jgi:hypothetical protein
MEIFLMKVTSCFDVICRVDYVFCMKLGNNTVTSTGVVNVLCLQLLLFPNCFHMNCWNKTWIKSAVMDSQPPVTFY